MEQLVARGEGGGDEKVPYDGARLASLYRRCCEDLALAQARAYPVQMVQQLESLTQRAHRLVYRRQGVEFAQLRRLALIEFPQAVRAHARYVAMATALFAVPLVLAAWASWRDPGFVLHLLEAARLQEFDAMYGPGEHGIGHRRDADTDWAMFGFYILNNIGVGFQCFAAGLFAGVGSAFYLLFNGLFAGALGGWVVGRGHGTNFFSFVVTHSAFEITAIVLAGAAGLRIGHAWVAPGQRTRLDALKAHSREAVVVIYGVVWMLLVAAAIEAFWSSARWVEPEVKYGVGAACWALVLLYLARQGRPLQGGWDAR
nr:stage II sporulation protein M [Ramlibacter albus]